MPHKPPPRPPNGGKWPNAGRKPGTPNKISVEVRELVGQLVNDPHYQARLRADFRSRKVHPTIESLIWTYHLGKPRQDIHIDGRIDVNAKLEEERRIFASLDVRELERLAAKSQALVDEATALSRVRQGFDLPQDIVRDVDETETPAESLGILHGSDNRGYVRVENPNKDGDEPPDADHEG